MGWAGVGPLEFKAGVYEPQNQILRLASVRREGRRWKVEEIPEPDRHHNPIRSRGVQTLRDGTRRKGTGSFTGGNAARSWKSWPLTRKPGRDALSVGSGRWDRRRPCG